MMKGKEGDVIKLYTSTWELLLTFIKKIKKCVTVLPKKSCGLEFVYRLRLPFIDQPKSDIVFIEIITLQIYNIILTTRKHGIGPNDIITFNEELEIISTSII